MSHDARLPVIVDPTRSCQPPSVICETGLYDLMSRAPSATAPFVPSLMYVPHTHTTLRHYAGILHDRRARSNRPISTSDWAFLQQSVLADLGGMPLDRLTDDPTIIWGTLHQLRQSHGEATALRAYRLMRQLGSALVADRLAPTNPWAGTFGIVRDTPVRHLLTREQRAQILQHSLAHAHLAPVGLVMETGIALEEASALAYGDLDLAHGLMRVRASPHSTRFPRTIPLSVSAVRIIEEAAFPLCTSRLGIPDHDDRVFCNQRGTPYTPALLRGRIAEMREIIRVPWLCHRALVIDFIACAIRRRIDPVQIKDYLGLRNPSTAIDLWQTIPRDTRPDPQETAAEGGRPCAQRHI